MTTTNAPTGQGAVEHEQPASAARHEQPASAAERQFWVAEQVAPRSAGQRVVGEIRVDGPVRVTALIAALEAVWRRHEGLRTAYVARGRQVVRQALEDAPFPAPLVLPAGATFEEAVDALLGPDAFDIAEGRVVRTAVAPDGGGATVFVAAHHIAFDGLSHEVVAADLARAYGLAHEAAGATADPPVSLPVRRRAEPVPLDPGYRAGLTAYWRDALSGVPDLPGGATEPSQRQLAAAPLAEAVALHAAEVAEGLRERARRAACSPYALVLTAYGRALAELTGADDFCVGTPVATRTASQEDEVGCVLNTLPVRMGGLAGPDDEAVAAVWAAVVDAVSHVDLPCDEIIAACRTTRTRRLPLYQALFAFQSWQRVDHPAGPARLRTVPVRPVGGQAEIQFQVCERPDGTLEATAQAPLVSDWAGRLGELQDSFRRHLDRLAADRPLLS
ncbi:condensation domain-containing protein [Streptomyces lavendofoliae]|uniref:condensation domain-containing protein n=1 Tax=Streptomyces lavendofoliae TaxID=67314 RepID=UPI003D8F7E0F